jgi:hypothetical protein
VEARLVHTEEAAGSNPASPTSSGFGVRPGQKLFRTDPIRSADGVFPCRARSQLTADPAHAGRPYLPSADAAAVGEDVAVAGPVAGQRGAGLQLGVRRVHGI